MKQLFRVKKGHTVHINSGKHYSEDDIFMCDDDTLKGQEYKVELVSNKSAQNLNVNNRAITESENRGI